MQWRDATVGGRDTTGFGVSGSDAPRQQPDLRQIQAGHAGQLWPLAPGGAAARWDPPCTQDPELFFAESPQDVEQAKAICRGCGARIACLAGALERREPCGVWGGELVMRGAIVPRKRPRGRPRKEERKEEVAA
jgi:WhiB family transcriptional regulator, redox-sensing transcriptional regulator